MAVLQTDIFSGGDIVTVNFDMQRFPFFISQTGAAFGNMPIGDDSLLRDNMIQTVLIRFFTSAVTSHSIQKLACAVCGRAAPKNNSTEISMTDLVMA